MTDETRNATLYDAGRRSETSLGPDEKRVCESLLRWEWEGGTLPVGASDEEARDR